MKNNKKKIAIESITIGNFKSFAEKRTIVLNDLTIFSGVNGAGKSSIAQILLLLGNTFSKDHSLKITTCPYFITNGYGNSNELLYDEQKPLIVGVNFEDGTYLYFEFKLEKNIGQYDTLIDDKEYLLLNKAEFFFKGNDNEEKSKLTLIRNEKDWDIIAENALSMNDFRIIRFLYSKFKDDFLAHQIFLNNVEDVSFLSLIPDEISITEEQFLECFDQTKKSESEIKEVIDEARMDGLILDDKIVLTFEITRIFVQYLGYIRSTKYLGPFRGEAKRIYTLDDKNQLFFTKQLLKRKNIPYTYDFDKKDGDKIVRGTYEKALNYWMSKKTFDIADKLIINEIIDDSVSETLLKKNGKDISINNDGFGFSQLLPLIATCIVDTNEFIIIDEPEVHLHPRLQSKIGEFIFIMSLLGKKIIVETHSEYIINKLNYFRLKHEFASKGITSYWVEKTEKFTSTIRPIEYDEYGFIKDPPEYFFDELTSIIDDITKLREKKLMENE